MSRTSKTAKHMSQCHYCTKCAGCAQPFSRWGCTIRSHSCSFQMTSASGAVGRTQCKSLLSELICGSVNANDEVSSVHSMGTQLGICIQAGWAIAVGGGTGPSHVFGLSFKYQCHPLRTGGDEILTNRFFTREAWIFYHGLRGKGAGGLWYGGVEKSKYYGRF